jgi:hypothetical protein
MNRKIFVLLLSILFFCLFGGIILAQTYKEPSGQFKEICDKTSCELENPLGTGEADPRVIIGQGIRTILGIVGSVALAVFIYGGILWLTSGGNEQRITKGKDVILWATLGLVVIFAAYAIVGFFLGGGFLGIFFAV